MPRKKTTMPNNEPGIIAHEGCDKCQWWLKPRKDRGGEYFSHCWGLIQYDVDAARLMGKDNREIHEVPIEKLAVFVDYPKKEGTIEILKISVDEKHVDHVNLDEPVILAFGMKARSDEPNKKRHLHPIDGTHRIAKAIKLGHKTVKCIILSEDETDMVMKDYRPPEKKKAKSRKK
jgi:hypothetical protein